MMEAAISREDSSANLQRQSSLRPGGSYNKPATAGRYIPRLSPSSLRRLRSGRIPRRESSNASQWFRGNRVLVLLMLIALWAYLGFHIQSQWAHNNHYKAGFTGYNGGEMRSEANVEDLIRISDVSTSTVGDDPITLGSNGEAKSNVVFGRQIFPPVSKTKKRKKKKRMVIERRLRSDVPVDTKTADYVPRRNTSYGLLVGPFEKTAENILGWSPEKRKGTCDRKSDFARLVWSRKFVLVFNELSMTTAPISMMELATEILSCGGYVTVVPFSKKGELIGELLRRNIKVLADNSELGYKTAMKADLVIVGSAASSLWIERYLKHFPAGTHQILWWIMETQRESFDTSKKMLDQTRMVAFLSEAQSKQWLAWCEEEKIKLRAQPEVVHLPVSDEMAFVAGLPCSLNTPLFSVEKMQERRNLLRVAVRKEMGLSDEDMLIVSLGSINPGNGQSLLLESALMMMTETNLPLIDIKIETLNVTEIAIEDNERNHRSLELEKSLLGSNNATSISPKNKTKKKHSRKTTRRSRNLLATTSIVRKKPVAKIFIGSVGSKSNNVSYIKGILRFLSQKPNLSKSVLWTAATSHVSPIYAAADVYLLNAQGLGEAFDKGTIEAMAFSLPVLGTDAGGIKEMVDDKKTGLLHPVGKEGVRNLALDLKFLLTNPSAREQLGSNGRFKVERMFLKRHMYKKFRELFVKCMKIK